MRTKLKKFAKRIATRIIGRPILGRSILLYHRIAEAEFDPFNIAVSPREFERQLSTLRSKVVLPLQEFATLHLQSKLPRNAVAITFDDGYACNALVAAPMLQSLNYPATFFVVSDAIERAEEFWWDQLEFVFRAPGFDHGTAMHLLHVYSGEILERGVRRESSSTANFLAIWAMLRRLSAPQRRKYLDDLRGRMELKAEMRQTHRPLTVAELRALAANPLFEIGGHTVTHPSLPILTEVDQEDEIVRGSRLLETMLGKPIRSFAYPFGDWLPVTREIVSHAGFKCAVTGVHRRVKRTDNKYAMPRRQAVNWYARTL
jgi:peptidoglycan/xylan/chitin deacetylase (PgdA/CDA1 family)